MTALMNPAPVVVARNRAAVLAALWARGALQCLGLSGGGRIHLAIFVEPFLSKLLDGTKTLESRWSARCIPPYRAVENGDLVVVKRSGGYVRGAFRTWNVDHLDSEALSRRERCEVSLVDRVRPQYAAALGSPSPAWWDALRARVPRYVSLIHVGKLVRFSVPFALAAGGRAGWEVLK